MIKKTAKNTIRQRRHARVRAKLSGTASRPRLSIYRSNLHIHVQLIDDVKGHTLASSSTIVLGLKGANVQTATKVGKDIGEKAIKLGISEIVFDRSGYNYHGRIKALADSAREAGLKF